MRLGERPKRKGVRVQIVEQEGSKPVRGRSQNFMVYELSFEEIVQRVQAELERALAR
jgi:hypothetical protein